MQKLLEGGLQMDQGSYGIGFEHIILKGHSAGGPTRLPQGSTGEFPSTDDTILHT